MGTTEQPIEQKPRAAGFPRRERRVQLLDSALEVFVAQGYHAAAMDDIAERAGVSKPVLYQHFPGKLDLYLALLDAACDAGDRQLPRRRWPSTHDNKTRVAAAMAAFYAYVAGERGAFRLVFESDLTSEPAVREHVERVTTECAAMIADVIHDDTGLPAEQSRLLAVSLVGMAQVSARFWVSESAASPRRRRSSWSAAWPGAASAATPSPTSTDHATDEGERWKSRSESSTHPASWSSRRADIGRGDPGRARQGAGRRRHARAHRHPRAPGPGAGARRSPTSRSAAASPDRSASAADRARRTPWSSGRSATS